MSLIDVIIVAIVIYSIFAGRRRGAPGDTTAPDTSTTTQEAARPLSTPTPSHPISGAPDLAELKRQIEERKRERAAQPAPPPPEPSPLAPWLQMEEPLEDTPSQTPAEPAPLYTEGPQDSPTPTPALTPQPALYSYDSHSPLAPTLPTDDAAHLASAQAHTTHAIHHAPRAGRRPPHPIIAQLRHPQTARNAFLLAQIFGPPKALEKA